MIYFDVPEARQQLLCKNIVYTLRRPRSIGRTKAVMTTSAGLKELCLVEVSLEGVLYSSDTLKAYLSQSGFDSIDSWLFKAGPEARNLYKVIKLEEVKNER